jgi:hypothetical protein
MKQMSTQDQGHHCKLTEDISLRYYWIIWLEKSAQLWFCFNFVVVLAESFCFGNGYIFAQASSVLCKPYVKLILPPG